MKLKIERSHQVNGPRMCFVSVSTTVTKTLATGH